MQLTTRGTITRVFDKREGVSKAGKAWASQDFGFVEDGTEDMVVFNIFGDDIITNVALKEGDDVTIKFDVRSREYNGRFYTEVRFIECEKMANTPPPTSEKPQTEPQAEGTHDDSLPF